MPRKPSVFIEPSYEQALQQLEEIADQLESGQLPLDQLMEHYARGAKLLDQCRARLAAVENQVQLLGQPAGAEMQGAELEVAP